VCCECECLQDDGFGQWPLYLNGYNLVNMITRSRFYATPHSSGVYLVQSDGESGSSHKRTGRYVTSKLLVGLLKADNSGLRDNKHPGLRAPYDACQSKSRNFLVIRDNTKSSLGADMA
jgi:hypothetical protein